MTVIYEWEVGDKIFVKMKKRTCNAKIWSRKEFKGAPLYYCENLDSEKWDLFYCRDEDIAEEA